MPSLPACGQIKYGRTLRQVSSTPAGFPLLAAAGAAHVRFRVSSYKPTSLHIHTKNTKNAITHNTHKHNQNTSNPQHTQKTYSSISPFCPLQEAAPGSTTKPKGSNEDTTMPPAAHGSAGFTGAGVTSARTEPERCRPPPPTLP